VSIEDKFRDLFVEAVQASPFDPTTLCEGFNAAMLRLKGMRELPFEDRDRLMDRLIEMSNHLENV